jgi:hypothetical protein
VPVVATSRVRDQCAGCAFAAGANEVIEPVAASARAAAPTPYFAKLMWFFLSVVIID